MRNRKKGRWVKCRSCGYVWNTVLRHKPRRCAGCGTYQKYGVFDYIKDAKEKK